MRHQTNQQMFYIWDEMRGNLPAPSRSHMEATTFVNLMPSIFMVKMLADIATIHLAGGDICALFGQKLRGKAFASLWLNGVDRKPSTLARRCAIDREPFLIEADGLTHQGKVTQLEMIMLPLANDQPDDAHLIGTIARIGPQLGPDPMCATPHIIGMSLTHIRPIERGTLVGTFGHKDSVRGKAQQIISQKAGRQIKHLNVIDGGRQPFDH